MWQSGERHVTSGEKRNSLPRLRGESFKKDAQGRATTHQCFVHPEREERQDAAPPEVRGGRGRWWHEGPRGHTPRHHPGDRHLPGLRLPAPYTCLRVRPEALRPPPPASLEEKGSHPCISLRSAMDWASWPHSCQTMKTPPPPASSISLFPTHI